VEGPIAIGALLVVVVVAVWFAIAEAKSGATKKEALKATKEVVDGLKRFEKARRDSAGMSRRDRVWLMLQELRAGPRPAVPEDE
jgi:hypothetical protein